MPMSPAERQAKLDNWTKDLIDRGKLSAEAVESFKSSLTPEAVEYVVSSQLRQQESDKWYQESQKLQTQLKSDIENLANWRKEAQAQIDKANLTVQQTAAEKAALERTYLEARTKLATNYEGVDQNVLNELLPVPQGVQMPQNPAIPNPPSLNGNGQNGNDKKPDYITRNDLLSGALDILKLQDQRIALAQQHRQLFNEELTDFTGLVVEADTKGQKLEDAWSEKYGVKAKQEAIAKANFDAAVAKAFADGKMQGQTERSIPTTAGMNSSLYGQPTLTDMLQDKPRDGAKAMDDEIVRAAALDYRQRQAEALAKQGQPSS